VLAVLFVTLPAVADADAASGTTSDDAVAGAIGARINSVRTAKTLRSLRVSSGLVKAARQHATSMAQLGYFSHSSSDGASLTRRLSGFYPTKGAIHWAVGEIMIWVPGNLTADVALSAWLSSAPHRREIFTRRWREFGIAVVHAANAPGVYGGCAVTIAVVDFGARA
jgi:uncharacterized protein YkwD